MQPRPRGRLASASSRARSAPSPTCRPSIEARRLRDARARAGARRVAGHPARPPRRAAVGAGHHRVDAREVRARDPRPAEDRDRRGRGTVRQGPEGLVGDAAQAQPDRLRADRRPGAARCAPTPWRRSRTSRSGTSATSRTRRSSASSCRTASSRSTTCCAVSPASCRAWWSTRSACARTWRRSRGVVFSGTVLLELARRGVSREQAYEWVQRNAMRSFARADAFKALLLADADVTGVLPPAEIERAFDLDEQLRHVDDIFDRVFAGAAAEPCRHGRDAAMKLEFSSPSSRRCSIHRARTIAEALHTLGYGGVGDVRQGKYFELDVDAASADAGPAAGHRRRGPVARQSGDRELPLEVEVDARAGRPGARGRDEVRGRRVPRLQLRPRRLPRREARARPGRRVRLAQGDDLGGADVGDPARRLLPRRLPAHRRHRALLAGHGARSRRSPPPAGPCSASATASRCCSRPACCRARCCSNRAASSAASTCTCASSRPTRRSRAPCRAGPGAADADRPRRGQLLRRPDDARRASKRNRQVVFRYATADGDGRRRGQPERLGATTSPASATRRATSSG